MPKEEFKGKKVSRGNRNRRYKKDSNRDMEHGKEFHPGNDFSWWNKVPELLSNASNLKSNWIPGTSLAKGDIDYCPFGVVRYLYTPTYGVSITQTDPLNVWARDLYLRMFQKWRGISQYSATDLGIVTIAGLEVIRMIAKLERLYGVLNRYSRVNLNIPSVELEALGVGQAAATYLRDHLSDFRYDLNELIRRAQRLCVPKDISVIEDQLSLLGYEYLDHDNVKGQIIVFDSNVFGEYSDTALTTGGCVSFYKGTDISDFLDTTANNFNRNMCYFLEIMLNALLGSDGVQKIYGDLLTWFGEDQLIHFEPVPEDYVVTPVFSESILHKMHNMLVVPGGANNVLACRINNSMQAADIAAIKSVNGYIIYQYNGNIVNAPVIVTNATGMSASSYATVAGWQYPLTTIDIPGIPYAGAQIIDTYRVDVSDEVITEGALWKFAAKQIAGSASGGTGYCYEVLSCAFEIINQVTLFGISGTTGNVYNTNVSTSNSSQSGSQSAAGVLAIIDWAPMCNYVTSGKIAEINGDIDTPIPVYTGTLRRIHEACVYSGLKTDVQVRPDHR